MKTLSPRLAAAYLRRRVRPKLQRAASLTEAARAFDVRLPYAELPEGFRAERIGGVNGEWAGAASDVTLLYLHGGAFFTGSPKLYRPISAAFAAQGFSVFTPAYRLAPRHPFPAALDDIRAVYATLVARGGSVAIAGDSAGGGLALALLLEARDAGAPAPKAAALFSPWTDLAVAGASARENEASDPLFTRRMLRIAARAYLAGAKAEEPLASPLYADLRGLPPLLLHVGERELLRDDSERLAARVKAAGGFAELRLWPEVPHCWQLAAALLPEAQQSIREAADFMRRPSAWLNPA